MSNFYTSLFQGLKLFFLFSLLALSVVILRLVSIFIPTFNFGSLGIVLIFQLATGFIIIFVSYLILSSKFKESKVFQSQDLLKAFQRLICGRQFIITLFSILSFVLLSNVDIMFVKKFFLSGESGIYSSWSLFAKIILYIVTPLTQISFVFFASNTQKKLQDQVLLVSLGILFGVGVAGYIGYTRVGALLISSLFGDRFMSVLPYLGFASIYGTFYAAISLLNTYFLAKKSRCALILIILLPLYLITLFFLPKTLAYLMWTNIVFSALVATSYLSAFLFKK